MTGGTGLLGRHLIASLPNANITVLSRQQAPLQLASNTRVVNDLDSISDLDDYDAVINLAGEPIVGRRWTRAVKSEIEASRIGLTEKLVEKILNGKKVPPVFISGSAVGIYGNTGDRATTEKQQIAVNDQDFAQTLCSRWEQVADQLREQTRVVLVRTGVVLSAQGGALAKMLLPFRLGLGGPIGSGKQYMPWIHRDDVTAALQFILANDHISGPVNLVSPSPATSREFAHTLASVLRRPAIFRTPQTLLKIAMGEAAQLLTDSQLIYPGVLNSAGFSFSHEDLRSALENCVNRA
jgi:uncharacterized protein (TIGR01777 family)